MAITIELPDTNTQQLILLRDGIERGCEALRNNLNAPRYGSVLDFDAAIYGEKHLLMENEGWQAPAPELISSWFGQFQSVFTEYDSEDKLAALLGLHGKQAGRRIRAFKKGETPVPYGIWRRFLVLTGRASQEIIPVLGIFDITSKNCHE
ncbi:hypothetical protein [Xenorhabdus bovienii]|uniref:Uncharacterized protein n=1 Tax=Xenorhabdus bovienii str. kraussei Becker Underwood TaxID=1398204 RepID=A0A077PTY4_XENBV|nr:hypothetical protein [Xenorhabdus bovienii]CDH24092.1 conserved hypothetical protein [Xenorhabdus bovienii str. kraussei Becker Underwood]